MKIGILITNPNHHVELTLPIAFELKKLGHEVKYISLCELRRMITPKAIFNNHDLAFSALKPLNQSIKPESGKKALGSSNSLKRKLLQNVYWLLKLKPFIIESTTGIDRVLLLNDSAFPGRFIAKLLKSKKIVFDLLQEGIRFPLPNENGDIKYGASGIRNLFSWGDIPKNYFKNIAHKKTNIISVGSPRYKGVREEFALKDSIIQNTIGIFTNPIDDQGFCTTSKKFELFENLINSIKDEVNKRNIVIILKTHPRESAAEYEKYLKGKIENYILSDEKIFQVIPKVNGGIIMATTVGLELLLFQKNVAQISIPNHGFVFDYVENKVAQPIYLNSEDNSRLIIDYLVSNNFFSEEIKKYLKGHLGEYDTCALQIAQELIK